MGRLSETMLHLTRPRTMFLSSSHLRLESPTYHTELIYGLILSKLTRWCVGATNADESQGMYEDGVDCSKSSPLRWISDNFQFSALRTIRERHTGFNPET